MNRNSLFDKMVDEAMEEVGSEGWRDASQNAVTLAAFGMLSRIIKNHMSSQKKAIYWAAGAIVAGVLSYMITTFLGHGG